MQKLDTADSPVGAVDEVDLDTAAAHYAQLDSGTAVADSEELDCDTAAADYD